MRWIESHTTPGRDPKTLNLITGVEGPPCHAIGMLHCLGWWAVEYAPEGNLGTQRIATPFAASGTGRSRRMDR